MKVEKLFYDFWCNTLRDSKVKVAKDHGKKFRSRLASSFSEIVHGNYGSLATPARTITVITVLTVCLERDSVKESSYQEVPKMQFLLVLDINFQSYGNINGF